MSFQLQQEATESLRNIEGSGVQTEAQGRGGRIGLNLTS